MNMKTRSLPPRRWLSLAAGTSLLALSASTLPGGEAAQPAPDAPPASSQREVKVEVETSATTPPRRELPWLGVSADEAPEVLTAQLGLDPGVGLVVDYVTENSPAAKAGLRKNDLLVEFEGQALVHPAQLRKLVQARKEGDLVKLSYYRGGKRETATAKLATTTLGLGLPGDELAWRGDLRELGRQLQEMPLGEEMQRRFETLRETFRQQLGPEQRRAMSEQAREAVDTARRAAREAMKTITNSGLRELRQTLTELERGGAQVSRDARVTVQSSGAEVKTMVQSDDSGTYVLIGQPNPHLTVHGKDGKLLFDGPVATPEEQAQVPREIWSKVEPMLDKLNGPAEPPPPSRPHRSGGSTF